ncbi:pyrimidodiazepine synthase-like [Planococcus citri]|uniref:pyrimidodiazepine synthase-like n=1 Tax=Planococcus citri TaxID=170843 RepID=UPI0031F9FDF5
MNGCSAILMVWYLLTTAINPTRSLASLSTRLIMEVKHFAEGSTEPPLQPGNIYLYSMRFCPYAHRAHLALNAKNVSYEPIYINLSSKPKWYLDKFPAGRVPALWYKNELLYESLLLADFINEEFPGNALYPSEPVKKLKDRMLIEKFSSVPSAFYKVAMVEFNTENFTSLINHLVEIEKELVSRGTKYFGGDKPLMVDYMIWPWFERLDVLSYLYGSEAKIPTEKIPNLVNWTSLMKKDEAVKKHFAPAEVHGKHFKLRKENNPGAFNLAV